MANEFFSGMRGPEAISKLNGLWDLVGNAIGSPEDTQSALSSATAAALSAEEAAASATSASTSATQAANSATSAQNSLNAINTVFDNFDDRFLGAKASDPTTDNDGNAILVGAIYYNTTIQKIKFYNGTQWESPEVSATNSASAAATSASQAATSATSASTSATNAATSASQAATSATNASGYLSSVQTNANSAAASATAAANSATSASSNAQIAINNATNAAASATQAAASATNADNSAQTAQAAVTSAQTYANSAGTSAANAANSFTSFTQVYIGTNTTNPETTQVGALYWNSINNEMRVWTGTAWIATYLPSGSYVAGPSSSVDNTIAVYDGTSGKIIKTSNVELAPTASGSIVTTADSGTVFATPAGVESLSNKTLVDPQIQGTVKEDEYTITDSDNFEIDPSNGSIQLITIGATRAAKATNFASGESVLLMVTTSSTFTITWSDTTFGPGGVKWVRLSGASIEPELSTSGINCIELWKVGTQVYGAYIGYV